MAQMLTTFLVVMFGISMLFYMNGLLDNTADSILFSWLLNPEGIQHSSGYVAYIGAIFLIVLGSAAVVVGYFGGTQSALISLLPITTLLLSFGWDFIRVFLKVREASPVLAVLIFSPLMIIFIFVVIDYWRGND